MFHSNHHQEAVDNNINQSLSFDNNVETTVTAMDNDRGFRSSATGEDSSTTSAAAACSNNVFAQQHGRASNSTRDGGINNMNSIVMAAETQQTVQEGEAFHQQHINNDNRTNSSGYYHDVAGTNPFVGMGASTGMEAPANDNTGNATAQQQQQQQLESQVTQPVGAQQSPSQIEPPAKGTGFLSQCMYPPPLDEEKNRSSTNSQNNNGPKKKRNQHLASCRSFQDNYLALAAYKEKEGHTNVPARYKDEPGLASFVRLIRTGLKPISDEQRQQLTNLGFDWETREQKDEKQWQQMFQTYQKYHETQQLQKKREKHKLELQKQQQNKKRQKKEGQNQEKDKKDGALPKTDGSITKASDIIEKLKEAKTDNKDPGATVPADASVIQDNDFNADEERTSKNSKKRKRSAAIAKTTETIGIDESLSISAVLVKRDRQLTNWIATQRKTYNLGKMLPHRQSQLEKIGFVLSSSKDSKKKMQIAKTTTKDDSNIGLTSIAHNSSNASGKQQATTEKSTDVDDDENQWQKQYDLLHTFVQDNGHCKVPHDYSKDSHLSSWVDTQCMLFSQGELKAHRKLLLDKIGFDWQQQEKSSRDNSNKNNDTNNGAVGVTRGSDNRKKNKQKKKKNTSNKKAPSTNTKNTHSYKNEERWQIQYDKLQSFHQINGHCQVPYGYNQDKSLGEWVNTQRTFFNRGRLKEHRKILLDKLGFAWRGDSKEINKKHREAARIKKQGQGYNRIAVSTRNPRPKATESSIAFLESQLKTAVSKLDVVGRKIATVAAASSSSTTSACGGNSSNEQQEYQMMQTNNNNVSSLQHTGAKKSEKELEDLASKLKVAITAVEIAQEAAAATSASTGGSDAVLATASASSSTTQTTSPAEAADNADPILVCRSTLEATYRASTNQDI